MRIVEKSKPKTSDVTIGIRNWACNDVSRRMGDMHAIVVSVVRRMGLKRLLHAAIREAVSVCPSS